MKRAKQMLLGAAVVVAVATAVSAAKAQALFAYPMQGQSQAQLSADRAACHEWAVAQTGHDPSLVFAAQQAGVPRRAITNVTRRTGTTSAGPVGAARGTSEIQRLNNLYDAYLRAGQVCLEARGYRVTR